MQIVIDIDDNLYTRLFDNGDIDAVDMLKACVVIRKGTPLPKGHGDLIDIDELNLFAKEHEIGNSAYDGELIYNAGETSRHDTIWKPLSDVLNVVIKADKEVQE